jgi:hypothetical protein
MVIMKKPSIPAARVSAGGALPGRRPARVAAPAVVVMTPASLREAAGGRARLSVV